MLSRVKATGEIVAIKIVSKDLITKLGKTRSVFREKDLLTELQHHFIIKLIAVSMDDDILYFVFESCENGDLADLI
jgi:serine/threonine protein kinase